MQGEILVGSRWQRICTEFHRINEQTCAKCIESDTQLANELNSGKRFSIYSCKNGLTDAASPIIIEDEHVANVFVGQFLVEPPDQEFFRHQAANYGFEETSYLDALASVPIVSKKKLPAILDFITSLAEMVATMGLKQIRQLEAEEALRESEERYRSLVETTSDWVWQVDQNGVYTYASPKVKDLLGYEPEEVVGKTPFDFMSPDEKEQIASLFGDVVKSRKPIAALENTNLHKDGRHVVLETSAVPLVDKDGNFLGYRGLDRDITERKQAETTLSQRSDELSALTSRVFSELPRSIEIIESEVKAIESAGEHVERVATIQDKLNTTKLLISNTFAFLTSEIEAVKPGTVSVSMAIHEAKEQLGGVITRTKANISHGSLPVVNFDQQKLVFLLSALLDNSIKFQDNDTPNVNISAEEKEDSLLFAVQDNGIGIDSYFLDRGIFELFCRSHNAVGYPGIGIGLAASKRIVESNGGKIWIESERGKGTTVLFTVPKR